MRVAVTVREGRVSPVFDVCREALVFEVEGKRATSIARETLDAADPSAKIARLEALGIEALICGAISRPLHGELTARGIRVLAFVAGGTEDVVRAFAEGALPSPALSMPGCGGRRARFRGGRGSLGGRGGGGGCRRGGGFEEGWGGRRDGRGGPGRRGRLGGE